MKRLGFLETKRTPRYSLRKLNVGVASVLLGVTIFGINFTDHSVKAATTVERVGNGSPSSQNSNSPQTSAVVLKTKVQQSSASNNATANNSTETATTLQSATKTQGSVGTGTDRNPAGTVDQNNTNTQKATSATEKVQQSSASNNATANNSTEAATTSQSAPKTQGSADTDIKSSTATNLVAISGTDRNAAAKLAAMNLVAIPSTNRNAAGTVAPFFYNLFSLGTGIQSAKENQDLANKTNLTSSDNYSSNIYKGKDKNYYKIVTINGHDYVYRAADIQANGTNISGDVKGTAEDNKNNINISKEDLGNGKTRWTVVFFPNKGLQNFGYDVSGLISAKFGIALTKDYQIVGNVNMEVISDPTKSFRYYTFEKDSTRVTEDTLQNPTDEVDFSFNPKTNVDKNTGLINSKTMPAYNNKYLQGPYYFTTATNTGAQNLWQTYFKKWGLFSKVSNNAYDKKPYVGNDHELHFNDFKIASKTGVDGAKYGDLIIDDKQDGVKGVFSSDNFNQAMEFKSQGKTGKGYPQYSSYVISFTTQHTDSHEVDLIKSPKGQQFSGISANIYSNQDGYYNMYSSLYGEQRALNAKGDPLEAKNIIPNWDDAKAANKAIDDALVNKKGEINNATNIDQATKDNLIKEATDAAGAAKNAIGQATTVDEIKKAQDDGVSNINNVKVPSLEDAKKAAKDAVDQAAGKQKDLINKSNNLSDSEKHDLNNKVDSATQTAKDAIDGATTNDGATKAGQDGKTAIEQVVPTSLEDAKKAAKDAVDQAAKTKDNAIDASNLTAEEKDALKKKVADEVKIAKDNIDAATKDADVTTAQTNGEKAINAVEIPTASKTKNDANSDLDNTADAAKKAIDETSGLTADQKQTAKDQIDQAVAAAKDNIKNASDKKGVADATDAGKLAIDKVSAKAAIDAAVAAKKSKIAKAPLTAEEAKPLNDLVDQEADAAKDAIDAATTNAVVEAAKNNGVETINNINVPATSATKDDANKAIDDALAKKIEEINNANLTDDQKQGLIDQAQNTANQAKENVRGASTDEDVQTAKNNGIAAINGITVKSNSVDDQDNSATNEGNGNQAGHIQSDNFSDVTKHSSIQQSGNEKTQLPQTGNETQRGAGLVGLAIAGLVGLLGSAGFRKKRD